jgi:hypothetical protein
VHRSMRGVSPSRHAANTWRDLLYPLPFDEARALNSRKVRVFRNYSPPLLEVGVPVRP